jgi:hypothetical protein
MEVDVSIERQKRKLRHDLDSRGGSFMFVVTKFVVEWLR